MNGDCLMGKYDIIPPMNTRRRWWMVFGFAAAFAGDWMLAVRCSPTGSPGFLAGVGCFALAHVLWMVAQLRETRPDWRALVALGLPVVAFASVRLAPVLPSTVAAVVVAYSAVSAVSLSVAFGGGRMFYLSGISLLVLSDIAIGARMLHVPGANLIVGPTYVLAEVLLLVSWFLRNEPRMVFSRNRSFSATAFLGAAAALSFVLAMHTFPGGYNPLMRMLSALGRTEVRIVEWPWSHYLFVAGMFFSVLAVVSAARRAGLSPWGLALNIAGLAWIALVPENVNMLIHNAGCWLAALGGGVMLFAWHRTEPARHIRRAWTIALVLPIAAMGLALVLHALKVVPFAPLVTTLQKIVILSFAAWLLFLSAKGAGLASRIVGAIFMCFPVLLAAFLFPRPNGCSVAELMKEAPPDAADAPRVSPLTADELAGLAWLEHVTGTLDDKEEREWWDIGGTQHGIFSKRYNIAFAGYAAVAVGMRGDAEVRGRVGKVLANCFERMLRADVWEYSQTKSYWGRKPWAPDPCYRENVMYTGHLLHLLALYELFTGDRRYHREGGGWDFVWKDGRKVHYDVEKLIEVTVEQMRKGPNGGITCEPGLMFFPCNSHPHVALAIFRKLGYGDWSQDAARWEKWALSHYLSPAFGGGEINLVYHVRGNFMYPRGQDGLDGWSLLWYEAWASDRRIATALWRRVRERLDWSRLDSADDTRAGYGCCDPQPVSACVASVFLAAAARACSDIATAERLERTVDAKCLRREGGLYFLDLDRRWRIGATAMRIISLAESNGSRFRNL